jgi:hypothetical protein
MKTKQTTMILASGAALYVAIAAFSTTDTAGGRLSFWQKLLHPVPAALADLSGGRLKSKYIAGADGSRLYEPDVLHDTTLDVDCAFGTAADGQLRCLPTLAPSASSGWGVFYYSDPQCTKPEVILNAPAAGCAADPPKYIYLQDPVPYCGAPAGGTPMHIYPVGALIGAFPAGAYVINGGECKTPQGYPQGNFIFYELGNELPASTFAAGTPGTDP